MYVSRILMAKLHPACAHPVWAALSKVHFFFYKVNSNFNSTSSFSKVDLNCDHLEVDGSAKAVHFADVFDFDTEMLVDPEKRPENLKQPFDSIIKFIKKAPRCPWPPYMRENYVESDVVLALSKYILSSICQKDEVILEKKNLKLFGLQLQEIRSESIGIGSPERKTWHGTSDGRVKGCPLVASLDPYPTAFIKGDDDDDGSGSDHDSGSDTTASTTVSDASHGRDVHLEGKRGINWRENISQVVSTCVVASFTEHNLHPRENPLIPTILFDLEKFIVCLYDCEQDILLISDVMEIKKTRKDALSRSAVLFLWMVINHRYAQVH